METICSPLAGDIMIPVLYTPSVAISISCNAFNESPSLVVIPTTSALVWASTWVFHSLVYNPSRLFISSEKDSVYFCAASIADLFSGFLRTFKISPALLYADKITSDSCT